MTATGWCSSELNRVRLVKIPSGEHTNSNGKLPSRNSGFSHEKLVDLSMAKCKRSPEGKSIFTNCGFCC